MDALHTAKNWIGALTDIALMLLGLAIALGLLVGTNLPFFGNVTKNLMEFVAALGAGGLVGLIVLGVVLWLFSNRSLA
jgi:hypothetical protein